MLLSDFYASVPGSNGEVLVTPKDILDADDGIDVDVCSPEGGDLFTSKGEMATDDQFFICTPTDASYAADETSRRSDLGLIIFLAGGPVDWDCM